MKYALLALLAREPAHGYELKQTYERLFAAVLPAVNAGQIYTTLARLERDGLVAARPVEQGDRPDKRVYQLTAAGQTALQEWLASPTPGPRLKDEFLMKWVLAQAAGLGQAADLIERQRRHYLQNLRDLNNLAARPEVRQSQTAELLIQGAILHLKADLQWLDLCEGER
ncbi:MAG: PadR family transcriptional regulator [Chloroflexota bacterium]